MANRDFGESSRTSDQNDAERPLKKARYVWEVKGKYHLKEAYKNNEHNRNNEVASSLRDHIKVRQVNEEFFDDSDNNNVVVNNNEEDCCKKSVLAHAENVMNQVMNSSGASDNDSSDDDERTSSDAVPESMIDPTKKTHSRCLTSWQAKHIARGFVDNTINRVIETYGCVDQIDYVGICEVLREWQHMPDDAEVENEGISMAIQSHGLQAHGRMQTEPHQIPNCHENQISSINSDHVTPMDKDDKTTDESATQMVVSGSNSDSIDAMNCDSLDNQDQDDFMTAAVSAAIHNKGLSSSYS